MKIRTEAKIHVFFDKHIGLIWQTLSFSSLFLIILLLKFLANNPVIIMNNNILTSMVNLCIGLSLLLIPIFILLFSGNLPDIFDFFFANIKFKHDKILLCHLLLKNITIHPS